MSRNYFLPGGWKAICDRCGRDFKNTELRRDWRGMMVCRADYETRHPQDFVRPITREGQIPWSRPDPAPSFVDTCVPNLHNGAFVNDGTKEHNNNGCGPNLFFDGQHTFNSAQVFSGRLTFAG